MRVLCYAQNLVGVGHLVRMRAIARGLAAAGHEVHLVDGGRAVPGADGPFHPRLVPLPRLVRTGGRLVADEPGRSVPEVMADRRRRLVEVTEHLRPEAVLVDHYPFSRWELDGEIGDAIGAARRAVPGVRVICSVREYLLSNFRLVERDAHEQGVLARLGRLFDGVLIHTDPGFARLEETFGRAGDIALPRRYTGFVVDRLAVSPATPIPARAYAVLSCGGSASSLEFLLAAIEAFRRLRAARAVEAMPLVVFPGPIGEAGARALRAAIGREPGELLGFSPDFRAWLAGAALSISRAGYNTCCEILAAGVRGVVVPNPESADQALRARRLAELGLATAVEADRADADGIAAAAATVLGRRAARHGLDLDGVAATRAAVEASRW